MILKRTEEDLILIPGKPMNFLDEFRRIIASNPPRTGKPENWPSSRMKAVWRTL